MSLIKIKSKFRDLPIGVRFAIFIHTNYEYVRARDDDDCLYNISRNHYVNAHYTIAELSIDDKYEENKKFLKDGGLI